MKIEQTTFNIITADEGNILTDGNTYGKTIILASDSTSSDFYEITEAEYEEILEREAELNEHEDIQFEEEW